MIKINHIQAKKYREIINKAVASLTDEDGACVPMLFERWVANKYYIIGDRVCYEDNLYKVLQNHTSYEVYTPDIAVSLYAKILIPNPSVVPEWEQPDSTNAYKKGDRVMFEGQLYESTINSNVWAPNVYGWILIE